MAITNVKIGIGVANPFAQNREGESAPKKQEDRGIDRFETAASPNYDFNFGGGRSIFAQDTPDQGQPASGGGSPATGGAPLPSLTFKEGLAYTEQEKEWLNQLYQFTLKITSSLEAQYEEFSKISLPYKNWVVAEMGPYLNEKKRKTEDHKKILSGEIPSNAPKPVPIEPIDPEAITDQMAQQLARDEFLGVVNKAYKKFEANFDSLALQALQALLPEYGKKFKATETTGHDDYPKFEEKVQTFITGAQQKMPKGERLFETFDLAGVIKKNEYRDSATPKEAARLKIEEIARETSEAFYNHITGTPPPAAPVAGPGAAPAPAAEETPPPSPTNWPKVYLLRQEQQAARAWMVSREECAGSLDTSETYIKVQKHACIDAGNIFIKMEYDKDETDWNIRKYSDTPNEGVAEALIGPNNEGVVVYLEKSQWKIRPYKDQQELAQLQATLTKELNPAPVAATTPAAAPAAAAPAEPEAETLEETDRLDDLKGTPEQKFNTAIQRAELYLGQMDEKLTEAESLISEIAKSVRDLRVYEIAAPKNIRGIRIEAIENQRTATKLLSDINLARSLTKEAVENAKTSNAPADAQKAATVAEIAIDGVSKKLELIHDIKTALEIRKNEAKAIVDQVDEANQQYRDLADEARTEAEREAAKTRDLSANMHRIGNQLDSSPLATRVAKKELELARSHLKDVGSVIFQAEKVKSNVVSAAQSAYSATKPHLAKAAAERAQAGAKEVKQIIAEAQTKLEAAGNLLEEINKKVGEARGRNALHTPKPYIAVAEPKKPAFTVKECAEVQDEANWQTDEEKGFLKMTYACEVGKQKTSVTLETTQKTDGDFAWKPWSLAIGKAGKKELPDGANKALLVFQQKGNWRAATIKNQSNVKPFATDFLKEHLLETVPVPKNTFLHRLVINSDETSVKRYECKPTDDKEVAPLIKDGNFVGVGKEFVCNHDYPVVNRATLSAALKCEENEGATTCHLNSWEWETSAMGGPAHSNEHVTYVENGAQLCTSPNAEGHELPAFCRFSIEPKKSTEFDDPALAKILRDGLFKRETPTKPFLTEPKETMTRGFQPSEPLECTMDPKPVVTPFNEEIYSGQCVSPSDPSDGVPVEIKREFPIEYIDEHDPHVSAIHSVRETLTSRQTRMVEPWLPEQVLVSPMAWDGWRPVVATYADELQEPYNNLNRKSGFNFGRHGSLAIGIQNGPANIIDTIPQPPITIADKRRFAPGTEESFKQFQPPPVERERPDTDSQFSLSAALTFQPRFLNATGVSLLLDGALSLSNGIDDSSVRAGVSFNLGRFLPKILVEPELHAFVYQGGFSAFAGDDYYGIPLPQFGVCANLPGLFGDRLNAGLQACFDYNRMESTFNDGVTGINSRQTTPFLFSLRALVNWERGLPEIDFVK